MKAQHLMLFSAALLFLFFVLFFRFAYAAQPYQADRWYPKGSQVVLGDMLFQANGWVKPGQHPSLTLKTWNSPWRLLKLDATKQADVPSALAESLPLSEQRQQLLLRDWRSNYGNGDSQGLAELALIGELEAGGGPSF